VGCMTHRLAPAAAWFLLIVASFAAPAAWGSDETPRQAARALVARNNAWFEQAQKYHFVYSSRLGWDNAGMMAKTTETLTKLKFKDGTRSNYSRTDYGDQPGITASLATPAGNFLLFPGHMVAIREPDLPAQKNAAKAKVQNPDALTHPFLAGANSLSDGKLTVGEDKDSLGEPCKTVRDDWTADTRSAIKASVINEQYGKKTPRVNGHEVDPAAGIRWFRESDGLMVRFVALDSDGTILLEERVSEAAKDGAVDDSSLAVPGDYTVLRTATVDEYAKLVTDYGSKKPAK
jgi:hypothetical protein